jgi:dienelactone hydrolase
MMKNPTVFPIRLKQGLGAAIFVFAIAVAGQAAAQGRAGAQSAEEGFARRQLWRVPSPDPSTLSQAFLFRPPGGGPFRLAVIAHASTQNAIRRAQMPQPEYRALAQALVARGYAVLVPERPGHGATGGPYLEEQGGCANANYLSAGRATAESIRSALTFMRAQPFIRKDGAIIVGHSAGGFGALALANADPAAVARIIVFAPGRGGRANDRAGEVCAPERLIAAAGQFGKGARVKVDWIVAENDSYFAPAIAKRMADAFRERGGKVDLRIVPKSGDEGHWLAEAEGAAEMDKIIAR